jgi:pyridinium-3,5-biscarboxylic acid mononucleotide sulfurtransferase
MEDIINTKYTNLLQYLKDLKKAAVAFSGGVDSSFLLAAAKIALEENIVAITIDSPALPRYELEDAIHTAALLKVNHFIIKEEGIDEAVKFNPVDRCYFCKKMEFGSVKEKAALMGIHYVLDGSNADDLKDYRPGMKATREVEVLSPLLENGLTKDEIRAFSKTLGLPTWNKPAYACLYSRIPYGQEITLKDLEKIEKSEKFFIDKGFRNIRVRCHKDLARIEVDPSERTKLLEEPLASEISHALKTIGFRYITIDIQGYRTGSMNYFRQG